MASPNTSAITENNSGKGATLRSTTKPTATATKETATKVKVAVSRLWVNR